MVENLAHQALGLGRGLRIARSGLRASASSVAPRTSGSAGRPGIRADACARPRSKA